MVVAIVCDLHLRFLLVVDCRHLFRNHAVDLRVERGHQLGWDRYDAHLAHCFLVLVLLCVCMSHTYPRVPWGVASLSCGKGYGSR